MLTESTYGRLVGLLDAGGARYRLIEHAAEGCTTAASALRNNSLAQAAKSMVVRVCVTKKLGAYLLAVIPGDKYVDLATLSRLVGGRKAAFAAREIAERLTASVSGSIAPFSFNPELTLIVDKSLLAQQELVFNAARLDRSIALHTEDYLTLANPRVEQIATDEAPARRAATFLDTAGGTSADSVRTARPLFGGHAGSVARSSLATPDGATLRL